MMCTLLYQPILYVHVSGVIGAGRQVSLKCFGGLTLESINPRVSRSPNRLTSMTWLNDDSTTAVPIKAPPLFLYLWWLADPHGK